METREWEAFQWCAKHKATINFEDGDRVGVGLCFGGYRVQVIGDTLSDAIKLGLDGVVAVIEIAIRDAENRVASKVEVYNREIDSARKRLLAADQILITVRLAQKEAL